MAEAGAVAPALRLRSSLRGEPSFVLDTAASVPAATADDNDEAVEDDEGGGDDGEEGLAVERQRHIFIFPFFPFLPWARGGGCAVCGCEKAVLGGRR